MASQTQPNIEVHTLTVAHRDSRIERCWTSVCAHDRTHTCFRQHLDNFSMPFLHDADMRDLASANRHDSALQDLDKFNMPTL